MKKSLIVILTFASLAAHAQSFDTQCDVTRTLPNGKQKTTTVERSTYVRFTKNYNLSLQGHYFGGGDPIEQTFYLVDAKTQKVVFAKADFVTERPRWNFEFDVPSTLDGDLHVRCHY